MRDRLRRGTDPVAERHGSPPPDAPQAPAALPGRPPAQSSTSVRVKRQHARPLTWAEVSSKVTNDPAVRYTDGGRAFLRWMACHATATDEWTEFVDAIPVHWLGDIGLIAASISEEWRRFAEWVSDREEAAS